MPIVGRTKLVGRTVIDWMGAEWIERGGPTRANRTRTQQHIIYEGARCIRSNGVSGGCQE